MSVGEDVRDAYIEVGSRYLVIRSGEVSISGEYCLYDVPDQVMRSFPREFILEASLPFDTIVGSGDIVLFDDGRYFTILSKTNVQYANEDYEFTSQILKCNVTNGQIMRSIGEVWNGEYHKTQNWQTIHNGVIGTVTEFLTGNVLSERDEAGLVSEYLLQGYISNIYDIQVLDRFQVASGEYYRVDSIRKRVFPNVFLLNLTEDTR
jgi:hypothetical protein